MHIDQNSNQIIEEFLVQLSVFDLVNQKFQPDRRWIVLNKFKIILIGENDWW